jgi:hypothetical protein
MDNTLVKWLRVIEGRGRASCAVGGLSSAAGPGSTRFAAFVLLLSQCLVFQRPAKPIRMIFNCSTTFLSLNDPLAGGKAWHHRSIVFRLLAFTYLEKYLVSGSNLHRHP